MEKDTDSMATVQMKPEYAPSEVYSTASEPPPAYKMRSANSVQIAKIIALTVIVSSFIIGSFILGATYLQAKASCDQVQVLDAMLDKELMLEAMQQDSPKAEALQARETTYDNGNAIDDENLTKDMKHDEDVNKKPIETNNKDAEAVPESDSSFSENDETEELNKNRVHIKLPLEFDLSDLANAIFENNQKSRMNCVVERRRAEEFVDAPGRTMQLPFGLNLSTDPKKKRITGERMAIFCESGTESRNEDSEPIKQIVMPIQAIPVPYGPQMQQIPFEHMQRPQPQQPQQPMMGPQPQQPMMGPQQHPMMGPQQHPMMGPQQHPMMYARPQMMQPMQPPVHEIPPAPQVHQLPPHIQQYQIPFHQIIAQQMHQIEEQEQQQQQQQEQQQQQIPVPSQEMEPPRPAIEQQIRIQLQRLPFAQISQVRGIQMPPQEQAQEQNPQVQVQRVPLAEALQRAGITQEDLRNIQRMAEERIQQELSELGASDDSSDSDSSSEEDDSQQSQEQHSIPPQFLQIGRSAYGRSLATPVRIPVPMMQEQANEAAAAATAAESERPHYVHPRSVRSVENVLHREKRIKRCACDCNC